VEIGEEVHFMGKVTRETCLWRVFEP
jgi:hypothetical protein